MGKSFGRTPEERDKYLKELEDMGMKDMRYYFPANMQTAFGFSAVTVNNERETVETERAYVEANNPVIAMAMFWESFWQQGLHNVITTYCNTISEALKQKYSDEDVPISDIQRLLNLLTNEEAIKAAIESVYQCVPDVMTVGSPYIVSNAVVKTEKDMNAEFKKTVDDLLTDVFKDVPTNEEE